MVDVRLWYASVDDGLSPRGKPSLGDNLGNISIGHRGSGHVRRLVYEQFQPQQSTHGINLGSYRVSCSFSDNVGIHDRITADVHRKHHGLDVVPSRPLLRLMN